MKNLLLVLLLTLLGNTTLHAYDVYIDGIYYNLLGDEATVTYDGNYSYFGSVVIPSTITYNGKTYLVTRIGGKAFYGCCYLSAVTIPNSVTSIDYFAFQYCSGLTSVTIPSSVIGIGERAFADCI